MNKKIFELFVVSKKSGRSVCVFYVKADSLYEAVSYADSYLVAGVLTLSNVFTSQDTEEQILNRGHEVYEAI